ncbi:unnamed protein product [Chrysoparadoxa australica]
MTTSEVTASQLPRNFHPSGASPQFILTLLPHNPCSGVLQMQYRVPDALCTPGHPLSLATALALFDETSTVPMMLKDKSYRAGVSLSLTGDLHGDVYAGDTLLIETSATKPGKDIAFGACEMRNSVGDLVFIGRHVKYMPVLGKWWDVGVTPLFAPVFKRLFDWHTAQRMEDPEVVAGISEGESLLDTFRWEGRSVDEGADGPVVTVDSQGTIRIQPRHWNFFKTCHGGAVSIAAEAVAQRGVSYFEQQRNIKGMRARSMEVLYLAPQTGSSDVSARFREEAWEIGRGFSTVGIGGTPGREAARAKITWVTG